MKKKEQKSIPAAERGVGDAAPYKSPPQGAKSLPTRWGGGRAQRWPEGLCPFAAARSLTGKLRAGHARPLRAMARCQVAAGAGGYGIRPYGGHRARRQ